MTPEEEQSAVNKGREIGHSEELTICKVALQRTLKRGHAPDTAALILARFKVEEECARQQFLDGVEICEGG